MSKESFPSASKAILSRVNKRSLLALAFVLLLVGVDFGRLDHFYSYGGDGQYKWIQTWSLLASNFQTEEVYYQNKGIDPDFQLYPIGFPYRLENRGRQIGQYPVFLSISNAPALGLLGTKRFVIFFMILSFALLVWMSFAFRFRPFTILLTGLGTPLLLYGYEVSEHPLLLLLQMAGLVLLFRKAWYLQFLSGLFLGLGIFLRLEVLIFAAILSFFLVLVYAEKNWASLFRAFQKRAAFFAGLSLSFLVFFVFNYWDYGHILGPRYLVNVSNAPFSFTEQFRIATVLLFGGYYKVGLFGFTPVFLLIFAFFLLRRRFTILKKEEQVLFWTCLVFVVAVAAVSPNDGAINWGSRYLNLAFIPLLILSDRFFGMIQSEKKRGWQIAAYICLVFSMIMFYYGVRIQHGSYKQLRKYQSEFLATKSNNILSQNTILIYHAGAMVLSHNFMNPRSEEAVEILVKGAKEGRWPDLVYIEPLPPKKMSGLAGEVFQKTLLGPEQKKIRQKIWNYFQVAKKKDLKHIRVYYLKLRGS